MKHFLLGAAALFSLSVTVPALAQSLNPSTGTTPYLSPNATNTAKLNSPNKWSYVAASGGITDTTAVTIKAAAGVNKKNHLQSMQIANAGAAGTEVLIRKGAAGTVIWRGYVGATSANLAIVFAQPLDSDANQLLEVVLSSGTTVGVRVNAQGYTD